MTTSTLTLADFLLARIADDEAEIKAGTDFAALESSGWMGHAAQWGQERAWRECAAKRRILAMAAWAGEKNTIRDRLFGPAADIAFRKGIEFALRNLAAMYADHPDYREEWRP